MRFLNLLKPNEREIVGHPDHSLSLEEIWRNTLVALPYEPSAPVLSMYTVEPLGA
jgi:hypothetical protein